MKRQIKWPPFVVIMSVVCLSACGAERSSLLALNDPFDGLEINDPFSGLEIRAPLTASAPRLRSVQPVAQPAAESVPPSRDMIDGRPYFRILGSGYSGFANFEMTAKNDLTVYKVRANRGNCQVVLGRGGPSETNNSPAYLRFGDTMQVHTQCNPLELELLTNLGWLVIRL